MSLYFPWRRPAPRVRPSFTLTISAILSLLVGVASADGPALTLQQAIQLAQTDIPEINVRRAVVDAAEAAITPAGELPDPQLLFGLDNVPINGSDAFSLNRDFMTMRRVGLSQTFTRGEKRALRTARAEALAERERALLLGMQLSVREAVARAWIERASAERRLDLLQSLRPRAEAMVDAATTALSDGRGSAADGIAAKSSTLQLEDRIDEAEREVADARAEFARWLPDEADRPLGDAPDWSAFDVGAEALDERISQHRDLLAFDAAEQAADADVALARAEKRPDWSVEMAYAVRGPNYSNMVSLQFRVDLPVFSARRQDPNILSRLALVEQIGAEREVMRREQLAELHKWVAAWRSASARVDRYEHELLPLAEDRVNAALAAYRGGRGDLQSSLQAFDNEIEQQIAYTQVTRLLGQSWAALTFAFSEEQ